MAHLPEALPPTTDCATWRALLHQPIKTIAEVMAEPMGVYASGTQMHFQHAEDYGYFILTTEVLELLAQRFRGKRAVEIGAGLAYLSAHLHEKGVKVVPTDSHSWDHARAPFCDVRCVDAAKAVMPEYELVILAWPPMHNSMAERALRRVSVGQQFLYQGEPAGSCCGTDSFFNLLHSGSFELDEEFSDALNDRHAKFPRYHDEWSLYTRVK